MIVESFMRREKFILATLRSIVITKCKSLDITFPLTYLLGIYFSQFIIRVKRKFNYASFWSKV